MLACSSVSQEINWREFTFVESPSALPPSVGLPPPRNNYVGPLTSSSSSSSSSSLLQTSKVGERGGDAFFSTPFHPISTNHVASFMCEEEEKEKGSLGSPSLLLLLLLCILSTSGSCSKGLWKVTVVRLWRGGLPKWTPSWNRALQQEILFAWSLEEASLFNALWQSVFEGWSN